MCGTLASLTPCSCAPRRSPGRVERNPPAPAFAPSPGPPASASVRADDLLGGWKEIPLFLLLPLPLQLYTKTVSWAGGRKVQVEEQVEEIEVKEEELDDEGADPDQVGQVAGSTRWQTLTRWARWQGVPGGCVGDWRREGKELEEERAGPDTVGQWLGAGGGKCGGGGGEGWGWRGGGGGGGEGWREGG